ncbi:MAG TPA: DinB family protein [Roseiflexaceae bacterium]|nr:DinB family protein [Roseiflexaceae bacterium]
MNQGTPTREEILAAYDAEEAALRELSSRISDEQWSGLKRGDGWTIHDIIAHIGEGAYGLARLAAVRPNMTIDLAELNEQRRQKSRALGRAEVEQRLASGFGAGRALLATDVDLGERLAGGPFPGVPVGALLLRLATHSAEHRQEIEAMLAA